MGNEDTLELLHRALLEQLHRYMALRYRYDLLEHAVLALIAAQAKQSAPECSELLRRVRHEATALVERRQDSTEAAAQESMLDLLNAIEEAAQGRA